MIAAQPATGVPTQAANPTATPPGPEVLARAERILKGDIRPDDYLSIPDELVAEVRAHYQRVAEESGIIATEEARHWTLMNWTLSYHFGGQLILRRRTDQGVIVLAVGPEEVGAVQEAFRPHARPGFVLEVPFAE